MRNSPAGQAKSLSADQQNAVIAYLEKHSRYPERDICIFLFSVKAGLRAMEIAQLEWWMVYDLDGNIGSTVEIPTRISKGANGKRPPKPRKIPMNKQLKEHISRHHKEMDGHNDYKHVMFLSERGYKFDRAKMASFFWRLYQRLGFYKCSSHSGRRTFITNTARQISKAGGSLLDVQRLAGHSSLQTTQIYIEENEEAKIKVVDMI